MMGSDLGTKSKVWDVGLEPRARLRPLKAMGFLVVGWRRRGFGGDGGLGLQGLGVMQGLQVMVAEG